MRLHKFNPCCHVFIPISCCTGTCVCLECIPRSAIYGVCVSLPVLFNNKLFSKVTALIYIPTSSIICCDSTFSLTLDSYPLNSNFCLSSGCTMAFHYDLICISLIINEAEHLSIWLLIIWISFYFWDVFIQFFFLVPPPPPTGFICFFFSYWFIGIFMYY